MEGLKQFIADNLSEVLERAVPYLIILAVALALWMVWR
ncbi:hypothetical protein X744_28740 [Mesorhizobium sp. LNJC372A00]|nr:hypothetical protein X745_27860 [Mesorhizobium sp. LNJC374B00]ESY52767.1 hypothetical protein X744_28740 [Mesorhizobium sp. LNJC372A00]